ncbi:MAG: flagellar hook basal-body protein [Nitrospiraceae bacterium]|nr:MAG: flagellar hook basal-body protein [Nitrospiraceae bacterium]
MYKGMYIALSGAVLKQKHMDIFAQNISNSNTTGFKKERISFRDYLIPSDNASGVIEDGRSMTRLSEKVTDFSHGPTLRTENPLDLAIEGEGFFALENDRFTRNGNFKISSEGYLTTQDNIRVLGDGGPIAIDGSRIDISTSGEIFVDEISTGNIKIVDFEDKKRLDKAEGGYFISNDPGQEIIPAINQGYLETSNVDVMREMVQMVTALRDFESYQKMIHAFDEASSKTINEMGR